MTRVQPALVIPLLAGILCAAASAQQTQVHSAVVLPSYKDLKFPPLPPIKVPEPTTTTLPNGMKVFLLENHELPIVNGIAIIRTGNLFDPPDKRGLAGITGEVMRSGGTQTKTGDQIDTELENIAASIESQIGESSGVASFSCLKESTAQVMNTFRDILTSPEFREDKVELAKTQARSAIARRNDDPNGILEREFTGIIYGKTTPYGWDINYSDIDNIHRQDLVDFYKRYYFPANVMLAVYGDFNTAEMEKRLADLFSPWTVKQPPVPKFPEVHAVPVKGVFLATKTDIAQTFFEIGHLGGTFNSKDYPALEVASEILGGGFSSRLFQDIRTRLGYAYNIGATWGANYDHPGIFRIAGSTQSVHTVDTIKEAIAELNRIRSAPVSDKELQEAKDAILNSFVFNFDRPSKTLNRLLIYEYYGYPHDFVFQYQKAVAAVTKEDVFRVAKEYFRPEDLTIVAVGNPADFKAPLAELGLKIQPIDLTIPEAKKPQSKVDPSAVQKGKDLLGKVQQVLGGPEKLAAIKDVQYSGESTIFTPGAAMKVKQRNAFVRPSSMRQDLELPFAKQSVYSNGSTGWLVAPQGAMPLNPAVLKQVQGEMFREMLSLVMSDHDPNRTVAATGDGVVEITDKNGDSAELQIDEKTNLPEKLVYSAPGPGGGERLEQSYSDWREVNGLRVPFHWTVTQNGKKFSEMTVQEYKINSGITDQDLSKRP